jgi:hypothetical protein
MDELDVNVLIQTFNEKLAQLTTELIVKEATIKQLNTKIQILSAAAYPAKVEKAKNDNKKQTDDFE